MPPSFVTFDEAAKPIVHLPKLYPRPTATNIQSIVVDLTDKLGDILP